jgi:hypothetical protein
LQAGLVNVVFPSYQAAESFGRRKRKVSSTDRRSGAFEKSLFDSFLFLFTSGGLRGAQDVLLRSAGPRRRRPVHEHVGEGLRELRRVRRWL